MIDLGWLIWLVVVGAILLVLGLFLIFCNMLDGFALAIAASGGIFIAVACAVVLVIGISAARGRDLDGRFAGGPLHEWFEGLRSGKGPCCSDADGYAISDAEWEATKDGHYRVRIQNKAKPGDPYEWIEVPDDAVITEPNRSGRTMVWPVYGVPEAHIRCFMPGSMI